jgi:phage terminase large subunit-like protein
MTVSTLAPRARRRMQPPEPPDAVTQYALDVVAGRVVAGVLVHKACERHLRDLADGEARGLHFDVTAAQRAINFFPLLRHYKGEWGPQPGRPGMPIVLQPWQQFIVGSAFGWKRSDGLRRFRHVYIEVAKKNGKTLMAAGIAILLAFFDGEPGAEVYSIATKRDQAKLVWNDARKMVKENPSLSRRIRRYTLSLSDERTASFFRPLGRDSGESEQGVNPHGYIVDELHVLEDREAVDNIETAAGARRQPMGVKITTAGVRRESVWAEERADAVAVVEGRASDDTMLVLIYTLDEGDDPFDEAVWPKANPNQGVSVGLEFLRDQAATAKRAPGKLAAFLRFHANIPTSVSTRAFDIDEWDANAGNPDGLPYDEWVEATIPAGAGGYEGLDLASVKDLTGLVLVVQLEGEEEAPPLYALVCRFWCPEDGIHERSRRDGVPYEDWVRDGLLIATPGNVTDYGFVRAEQLELAERYVIGDIGFDKWNATQLVTELMADGANCTAIPQTHAGLGPAWRELEKLMLEHRLLHGGHPILRWMAGNVETVTDPNGNQKPSKQHSSERIDGIVALTMGLNRWLAHGEAPGIWTAA